MASHESMLAGMAGVVSVERRTGRFRTGDGRTVTVAAGKPICTGESDTVYPLEQLRSSVVYCTPAVAAGLTVGGRVAVDRYEARIVTIGGPIPMLLKGDSVYESVQVVPVTVSRGDVIDTAECRHDWHRYGEINGKPYYGCQTCGAERTE